MLKNMLLIIAVTLIVTIGLGAMVQKVTPNNDIRFFTKG